MTVITRSPSRARSRLLLRTLVLGLSACSAASTTRVLPGPNAPSASPVAPVAPTAAATLPRARRALRRTPAVWGVEEAKIAVVQNGFYCKGWNENGGRLPDTVAARSVAGVLVVVDETAGLMWQRSGQPLPVGGGREGAGRYVDGLNARAFAGFHDWRLPTLEEAMSLMTDERNGSAYDPPDGVDDSAAPSVMHLEPIFEIGSSPYIWTVDLWADQTSDGQATDRHDPRIWSGWQVDFLYAEARREDLTRDAFVRAVRSI